jgi:toxin-antitoxin system PIN domain toxin
MIAVDTNLLVYANREDSPFHRDAIATLRPVVEGAAPWAIPWPCLYEFISVVTHARIYHPPTPLSQAIAFLESLLAAPQVQLLSEGPGSFEKLRELSLAGKVAGARIHDARIAALCLHHGISELWSADRDFSVFPQLRVRNTLVKSSWAE